MRYLKLLPLISLFFISAHTQGQVWKLVGDNSNGIQVYVDSASIQQAFGYTLIFDLKEHIRDTIIAGTPQFVDRFISYRVYPDTIGWKPINIHDTYPTLYWSESGASDFLGITFPQFFVNVSAIKKVAPYHQ
ncbi:MAG: hypothetical protein [Cryophage ML09]|nr:MAG: hypothetical protein [Cryophage ML09]